MFKLEIKTDNAAFEEIGEKSPRYEVCRILRELADRIEDNYSELYRLRDLNGNAVGRAEFFEEEN